METPFKRKQIKDEEYLKNLIIYIHNNPIEHNFVKCLENYKWSSYSSVISDTYIEREKITELFDNKQNFIFAHQQKIDIIGIEKNLNI